MRFTAAIWSSYDEDSYLFLENIDVTKTLGFGTQLNGGYASCSFKVSGPIDKSFWRLRAYLGGHVVIFDSLGRRIYEGRISDTDLGSGEINVQAVGYFEDASKILFDMIYTAQDDTDNLVENPSFEVNLDGWIAGGGVGSSAVRDTSNYVFGGASAKITQPNSGGDFYFYVPLNVTGGQAYTFSLFARNVNVGEVPSILIVEVPSEITTETKIYIDGNWRRFEVTATMQPGTTQVAFMVKVPQKTSAQGYFFVDGVQVENRGYASDYTDDLRVGASPTVSTVVADCIGMVPAWNHTSAFVNKSNYIIGEQDYTDKKISDALESVLKFGWREDDIRPVHFAIWNQRMPCLFPEPQISERPDWIISVDNCRGSSTMRLSIVDVYNKVYAIYDNQDQGPSKTLPAEDAVSKARYGTREGVVQNGGAAEGIELANDLRDMALAKYKYPRMVYSVEVTGMVMTGTGNFDYPYMLRAGQMAILKDLDILSPLAGDLTGQAAMGFSGFILSTDYDASSGSTRIDFGSADLSFETLMGRLGLSGGLS